MPYIFEVVRIVLLALPDLTDVLSSIHEEDVVSLLQDMIKIKSEPESNISEKEVAEFLVHRMRSSGIEVEMVNKEPNRPNIVGRLRGNGGGKTLLFNGHLAAFRVDPWTVDPYIERAKEGNVYGVGAADMKGAIAAMVIAMEAFTKIGQELSGDVIAVFGSGAEKGGLIGTKYVLDSGVAADMAVNGEPTGNTLVVAERGAIWTELVTHGIAGLTGKGESVNAIHKMNKIIESLLQYNEEIQRVKHPLLGTAQMSVNMIEAGQAPYTVPNRCRAVVDRRLLPGETTSDVQTQIGTIMDRLRKEDPSLKLDTRVELAFEPLEISIEEEIVKLAKEAIRTVTRNEARIQGFFGFTESVHIAQAGIPVVIIGPGVTEAAHTPNEWVGIQELVNASKIYAHIALKACGSETS